MSYTIYDVAKETGLSIATISRVINKTGLVKPQTEEKVLKAIKKLGYAPSPMAQGLVTNMTKTIGLAMFHLVSSDFEASYPVRFLSGILSETDKMGYSVLLENMAEQNGNLPIANYRRKMDGMVFMSLNKTLAEHIESMINEDFPVVYVGMQLPFDNKGCNIYGGYHQYKREMLALLYSRGYRNIVMLEHSLDYRDKRLSRSIEEIVNEYNFTNNGDVCQCRVISYDARNIDSLARKMAELIDSDNPPDAFCLDSVEVYVIVNDFFTARGLKIPEDVGVIITGHSKNSGTAFTPPLTCVFLDAFEMGKRAARLLITQIEGGNAVIDRSVPSRIIERESLRKIKNI